MFEWLTTYIKSFMLLVKKKEINVLEITSINGLLSYFKHKEWTQILNQFS
jgi:hypothetical protein